MRSAATQALRIVFAANYPSITPSQHRRQHKALSVSERLKGSMGAPPSTRDTAAILMSILTSCKTGHMRHFVHMTVQDRRAWLPADNMRFVVNHHTSSRVPANDTETNNHTHHMLALRSTCHGNHGPLSRHRWPLGVQMPQSGSKNAPQWNFPLFLIIKGVWRDPWGHIGSTQPVHQASTDESSSLRPSMHGVPSV